MRKNIGGDDRERAHTSRQSRRSRRRWQLLWRKGVCHSGPVKTYQKKISMLNQTDKRACVCGECTMCLMAGSVTPAPSSRSMSMSPWSGQNLTGSVLAFPSHTHRAHFFLAVFLVHTANLRPPRPRFFATLRLPTTCRGALRISRTRA